MDTQVTDSGENVMTYRPEDDFWVDDRWIIATLFFHTLFLNFLVYQSLYLLIIVCYGWCSPDAGIPPDFTQMHLDDAFELEPSDRLYSLTESSFNLVLTALSTYALLSGATLLSVGVVIIVSPVLVFRAYNEITDFLEFRDINLPLYNEEKIFQIPIIDKSLPIIMFVTEIIAVFLIWVVFYQTVSTTYGDYIHFVHMHYLL